MKTMTHELTNYERGFVEGAIDFEGHLTIFRVSKTRPRAKYFQTIGRVTNTNLEILKKVKSILDDEPTIKPSTGNEGPKWKPSYIANINTSTLRWVLPQLKLVVKRRQQKAILEFLNLKEKRYGRLTRRVYAKQQELYRRVKELNKRGRAT
jgi:hypothetical protein